MQADQMCVGRRLILLWLSLILTLIPLAPLHAQIVSPLPEPADENSPPSVASDIARPDEEVLQATVDALLNEKIDDLIAQMAVEDKVGQLFLIHFSGSDTSITSDIAVLIHAYRVGGVVLSPIQRNFTNQRGADTPTEVASLANRLQALAYGLLLPETISVVDEANIPLLTENLPTLADKAAEADRPAMNIPLFIGIEQLGDDLNVTSLRRDFTELPNQMTLGAAWNPSLTREIGRVVGQELSAVGANLLLGPSLDMLVQPRTDSVGKLGVHMYGGNPYWVSEMGRGYIAGIHEGSDGQLLTVVRHFPGQGDVDRLPDQEVATIQGDMEELRNTALAPFVAVTDGEPSDPAVTDMLMSSNMRFSGVQGTGPERIPPLGLAPNLTSLLAEEGFGPWLETGLIVSNSLGVPAIRRFYETDDGEFPARQVAQDAFGAGNDILYLGHFSEGEDWESERVNIESTISFFQERYEKDDVFADQVDAAVHRILNTKLRLNADMEAFEAEAISLLTETAPDQDGSVVSELEVDATIESNVASIPDSTSDPTTGFTTGDITEPLIPLESLLISNERLAILDEDSDHRTDAEAMVRQVARDSLTILYPDISELSEAPPQPPQADDKIVIFTDSRLEQECNDCTAEVAVGPDDIENIILLLYGPDATAQIAPEQLTSLTFSELVEVLDSSAVAEEDTESTETPSPILPTPTAETPAAAESESDESDLEADESARLLDLTAQIEQDIDEATWLIFAMLDVDPAVYSSDAVKRFLRERGDQIEGKKVVVLALQAPYFLDATEISALSIYLGVYSKSSSSLENAVRAIFRSYTPYGSPPVSVPGTRFADLEERLQPDPLQIIDLLVQTEETELPTVDAEDSTDAPSSVPIGTTIRVQVGPVVDKNGQVVPDNTLVEYQLVYEGEESALKVEPANTRDGIAIRDILLDRGGDLQISASSNEATTGEPYSLLVTESVIAPESEVPGDEAAAGEGVQQTGNAAASSPVTVTESSGNVAGDGTSSNLALPEDRVNLATLIVALLALLVTVGLLLIVQIRVLPRKTLVHNLLWTTIIGLAAYIIYGVGLLPGANWLYSYFGVIAAGIVVLVSMIATMLWLQLRSN